MILWKIDVRVDKVVIVVAEEGYEDHGYGKNNMLFGSVVYFEGVKCHQAFTALEGLSVLNLWILILLTFTDLIFNGSSNKWIIDIRNYLIRDFNLIFLLVNHCLRFIGGEW